MAMAMMMAIYEVLAVLCSGFMVGGVTEVEYEGKAVPERRHVAVVLVYEQIRQKSSSSAEFEQSKLSSDEYGLQRRRQALEKKSDVLF